MRIYLDTNIYSERLFNSEFHGLLRSLKKQGRCNYASSFEIVQEIVSHRRDITGARRIFRGLEELVSPHCISNEPAALVIEEISSLKPTPYDGVFMPPRDAHSFLKTIWDEFESPNINRICSELSNYKKEKQAESKLETREERGRVQITPDIPFATAWKMFITEGACLALEAPFKSYALEPPRDIIRARIDHLDDLRATRTSLAITSAQKYRQLLAENHSRPHRNDDMDARIGVTAAYCDIFITADSELRATLDICKALLPFKTMSPEEFASEAELILPPPSRS